MNLTFNALYIEEQTVSGIESLGAHGARERKCCRNEET